MASLLNSEYLLCCVPTVLVGVGAPLFAWRPKEAVSEHLAVAFEVGLARGVLLVGFLWDSFRIQALILVYHSGTVCGSVRNI